MNDTPNAAAAGTITLGGELCVNRLGFGAMRLTGAGIWGEPKDPQAARRLLQRAVQLGVNFIDTADSYGPEANERVIAEGHERRELAKSAASRSDRVVRTRHEPARRLPS